MYGSFGSREKHGRSPLRRAREIIFLEKRGAAPARRSGLGKERRAAFGRLIVCRLKRRGTGTISVTYLPLNQDACLARVRPERRRCGLKNEAKEKQGSVYRETV